MAIFVLRCTSDQNSGSMCRDLVAVAERFSLLSPSRHWLHYLYCVAIKWLFISTRSVLDSDSLNKLNWRQSKGRNKRSWTVRRERKFINCIGQDKCRIPTCINYTLKHNPLTRTTKAYGFSWQTKSYMPCCIYSKAITNHRLYWKNSGNSAAVDNSAGGGFFAAALIPVNSGCGVLLHYLCKLLVWVTVPVYANAACCRTWSDG